MKTLYIEMFSGIAGDMFAAAMLDLAGGFEQLREKLRSLHISDEFEVSLSRVKRGGLDAAKFDVHLAAAHHRSSHVHAAEHAHAHVHRNLADITHIIENSDLDDGERELALRIFGTVARAEAKAHGLSVDQVHFHEVGAVDSIVDIVSAAVLLRRLAPDRIVATPFYEGSGVITCAHGKIPVPAPATVNILAERGAPMVLTGAEGELVTPTGAAIVASVADSFAPGALTPLRIGVGAGTKETERANVVRVMLCEEPERQEESDSAVLLEANIDDSTGEELGRAAALLMEMGALDAWFLPIQMKKGRPAYTLAALCRQEDAARLTRIFFSETTTIGVRRQMVGRAVMRRAETVVSTGCGDVTAKRCEYGDILRIYPEFDSLCAAAQQAGVSLAEMKRAFAEAAGQKGSAPE